MLASSTNATFDPDKHHYFDPAGRRVPSVTQILTDQGYTKGAEWFTQASRDRGHAVHYAREMVDQHAVEARTLEEVLQVLNLGEALHGYVSGYLWFKRETGFVPELTEQVVYSPSWKAGGRFDIWGRYRDGRRVMIDTKSWKSAGSKPKYSAELQTGGYKILAEESLGIETDLRVVLKLPGDGTYRAYECRDVANEMNFKLNCSLWWDRYNHKLIDSMAGPSEEELAA